MILRFLHIGLLLGLLSLFLASSHSATACGLSWSPTVQDALRAAGMTKRLAVVVFTGSDWSASSAKLDQEVLMNVEFSDFFASSFALANADFPQRSKPASAILAENTALATRHGITRWPTLLALRPDGKEFGRIEYAGESASEMTAKIRQWQQDFSAQSTAR